MKAVAQTMNQAAVAAMAKSVLVGVSGGVDSSVAVNMLKEQGYSVFGAVINFSDSSKMAIDDAKKVCAHLNIPISVIDATREFNTHVILPFCQSYIDGKTPNPCVVCNPLVKFDVLRKAADNMGISYISTGHYAQIENVDNLFYVKKALSLKKDQSYMLYRLPQDILKRLLLPLGAYEKEDIRKFADNLGLFNAQKPDSQEICFIPDGKHAAFIEQLGYIPKKGFFISPENKKIKEHLGVHHYTVGQRKGLNIALGKPVFIKEIQENGDILLGYSGEEFFTTVTLDSPILIRPASLMLKKEVTVKVRSTSIGDTAFVLSCDDKHITLSFKQPVRAAAKGQSAVIYDGQLVIGGGFISTSIIL